MGSAEVSAWGSCMSPLWSPWDSTSTRSSRWLQVSLYKHLRDYSGVDALVGHRLAIPYNLQISNRLWSRSSHRPQISLAYKYLISYGVEAFIGHRLFYKHLRGYGVNALIRALATYLRINQPFINVL
jgi:hypothetical protein